MRYHEVVELAEKGVPLYWRVLSFPVKVDPYHKICVYYPDGSRIKFLEHHSKDVEFDLRLTPAEMKFAHSEEPEDD